MSVSPRHEDHHRLNQPRQGECRMFKRAKCIPQRSLLDRHDALSALIRVRVRAIAANRAELIQRCDEVRGSRSYDNSRRPGFPLA